MPRVIGIDPGTVSLDLCGLADGELYLDESWPTAELLAAPERLVQQLHQQGPPDLVVGPSGYGLPFGRVADASEDDFRLAFLAGAGESGGIGGLRRLARRLGDSDLPVCFIPAVIHLDTVPVQRKLNRVDLGTADKLCAAALAIQDQGERTGRLLNQVSLILLELGGAFTGGVAVRDGQVVDGIGGTSGPLGWRSAGALDGEVAFLADRITKEMLFQGGVLSIIARDPDAADTARRGYVEQAVKAVRQLQVSSPTADEVLLSGRMAADPAIREPLIELLPGLDVRMLAGFAVVAKQGAQGAALLADGLAGGTLQPLVERLRIRQARGTVLDHLHVISRGEARRRLGLVGHA
jgi:predicted butyrate kinase (DUF1464 family)